MGRDNDNTAIFIFGALVLFLIVQGGLALPGASAQQPDEPAAPAADNRADLRAIAAPWVAATNITSLCSYYLGVWHNEATWVGCEGVGALDCTTAAVQAASTQCEGTGATWTCSPTNIYCKYEV